MQMWLILLKPLLIASLFVAMVTLKHFPPKCYCILHEMLMEKLVIISELFSPDLLTPVLDLQ